MEKSGGIKLPKVRYDPLKGFVSSALELFRDPKNRRVIYGMGVLAGSSAINHALSSLNDDYVADLTGRLREQADRRATPKELRQLAEKLGVPLRVARIKSREEISAFIPKDMVNKMGVDKLFQSAEHIGPKDKKPIGLIITNKQTPREITYHEMGHADVEMRLNPVSKFVERVHPAILTALGSALQAGGLMARNPALAAIGGGISSVKALDSLVHEYRASKRALKWMEESGADKKELAQAKKNLEDAFKTYGITALGLLASFAGVTAAAKLVK